MSKLIDALGKACPLPVVMTKKEMDNSEEYIETMVDNKIAVENLRKLSQNAGYTYEVKEKEGIYTISFTKKCEECENILEETLEHTLEQTLKDTSDYVVFLGKNYIGEGSNELGENLMRMFLYTLSESANLPTELLLMNSGVKLAVNDEQSVEHLKKMKEKGVEILVCGTCLNYFEIAEQLKVGTVSNMYDITTKMQNAKKVISF